MIAAAEQFIAALRDLHQQKLPPDALWTKACASFRNLLADGELLERARKWPTSPAELGLEGKHANLLFYEDPDFGFVINGLIKKPHAKTTVHDHGMSWTLYGVVEGGEKVLRYERTDGGQPGDLPSAAVVEPTESVDVKPGYVDFIKPWEIHAEHNGEAPTVAVIVRSQRCGTYIQNIFYRDKGTVEQYYGPKQIPYSLA